MTKTKNGQNKNDKLRRTYRATQPTTNPWYISHEPVCVLIYTWASHIDSNRRTYSIIVNISEYYVFYWFHASVLTYIRLPSPLWSPPLPSLSPALSSTLPSRMEHNSNTKIPYNISINFTSKCSDEFFVSDFKYTFIVNILVGVVGSATDERFTQINMNYLGEHVADKWIHDGIFSNVDAKFSKIPQNVCRSLASRCHQLL